VNRNVILLVGLVLASAVRTPAQVTAGEASMNLSGTISAGYSDDYSNLAGSDHSVIGAGRADLSGSYYNPNFLSFDVQPFYNQSRLNSAFQSITASSGVSASTKIFGGSDFPGSISYSAALNSSGNFGIPGLPNFTTHGNNDTLAVTWGVHLDGLPRVNLSFSDGNNDYSVYGASAGGRLHSDTFSATTSYQVLGFNLNGGYQYASSEILTPEFLAGGPAQQSDSGDNSFFFGIGRNLPWHGSFNAGATRSHIRSDFDDTSSSNRYDTTIDTFSGGLNFAPAAHLNL